MPRSSGPGCQVNGNHSRFKQNQRAERFKNLSTVYKEPFDQHDRSILSRPIAELVQDVHKEQLLPLDILHAYGKVAVKAHERTNCATELMLPEAEEWMRNETNLKGPLAGIPISLKDNVVVKGFDVSVGYSRQTGKPYAEDGTHVKLLKEAGKPKISHGKLKLTDRPKARYPTPRLSYLSLYSLSNRLLACGAWPEIPII